MATLQQRLHQELQKLKKSPPEVKRLLNPEWLSLPKYPRIPFRFPTFANWLQANDTLLVDALTSDRKDPTLGTKLNLAAIKYESLKKKYETAPGGVREQLEKIASGFTGPALLNEISSITSRSLMIIPYVQTANDDFNADASDVNSKQGTQLGMPMLDQNGNPYPGVHYGDVTIDAKGNVIPDVGEGTGEGTNVFVHYTPGMWGPTGNSRLLGPRERSDEVLFHELFHAAREMKGLSYSKKVNNGYQNLNEYFAVVISNIYCSEKGRPLRANHRIPFEALADPEKFMDNPLHLNITPRQLMERFRNTQSSFFNALANLGAIPRFNPARDWKALRVKEYIDM